MSDLRETFYALSPRQREIIRLQRAGYSKTEILAQLAISDSSFRWHQTQIRRYFPNFTCATTPAPIHLTRREKQIICLLEAGCSTEEIACHLQISLHTVKFHLKQLYDKTNTTNRLMLVLKVRAPQSVVA